MKGIVDESTMNAMVSIFAVLLPHYEKTQPQNNLILQAFMTDETFYKDKLLTLAVKAGHYRLDKVL